jgi:3-isopropylmalate dehydratase small subunit
VEASRGSAVNALFGTKFILIITEYFAFVYGGNQANLRLSGIKVAEEWFSESAADMEEVIIDLFEDRGRWTVIGF